MYIHILVKTLILSDN